ncbi:MAG TPA: hypothetical protein PLP42_13790 [Acidobacteriota bacterium]|nr:hypothetical protein [Acidobacteriota bacterium]
MKKTTWLGLAALSSVVFALIRKGSCKEQAVQTQAPPPLAPGKVLVLVQGTLDDLEVKVRRWRTEIKAGQNITWEIKDPHHLLTREPEVNDRGKETNVPFPRKLPSPSPHQIVHGPFKETPDAWFKYNIILHTREGEIVVDPEYKIRPGTIG